MTTDELRAAAESWAANNTANQCPQQIYALTRAWLAGAGRFAPPADDGEPVTEEWLRAVGFQPEDGGQAEMCHTIICADDDTLRCGLQLVVGYADRAGEVTLEEYDVDGGYISAVCLPNLPTRGDVRRLATALGRPLTEGR